MARIVAENVVVDFPLYGGSSRSLKNTLVRAATGGRVATDASHRVVVRALDDVSFQVAEGDRVGILGHNGSGKTTLLRVIAGAYEPVTGSIRVEGQVAAMLSIMLGMDPEATGYENVYLRAAIMGLSRPEIEPLIEEICDFAELGSFINMPVRAYSSGMAMRLAFAISTSVPADIILMDEWMSVGDASFYEKAQARLNRLLSQAKILVLASHDENLIRRTCNRLIRLEHGRLTAIGGVDLLGGNA